MSLKTKHLRNSQVSQVYETEQDSFLGNSLQWDLKGWVLSLDMAEAANDLAHLLTVRWGDKWKTLLAELRRGKPHQMLHVYIK